MTVSGDETGGNSVWLDLIDPRNQTFAATQKNVTRALSDKTSLRRAGWSRSLSVWQNTPRSGTLKRALRSSAWLWCCMFVFRSHSVTWKIFCTNEVLRSATKQFGFGGATKSKGFPWEEGKP